MNTAAVPFFNGMSREEVVKEWVTALRSGQYKQTQERLRNGDSFCCLGVLCDLNAKMPGQPEWDGEDYLEEDANLPASLAQFIVKPGTEDPDYAVGPYAGLNDDGKTFAELADIIERDLL